MKITRRDALKIIGVGGAACLLPGSVFAQTSGGIAVPAPAVAPGQAGARPDLAVFTGADPAANLRLAVEALGGMGRFVAKGDKVVIKPNLGFGNAPEAATTTDPRVIREAAILALAAGAKRVSVLDNPCHKPEIVLEICGVKEGLKGLDDVFVFTVKDEKFFGKVDLPKAVALKSALVARDILEADCIINLPAAKSHGSALVTFSMKNWMGVVQDRKYWHNSLDLNQAIADMSTFVKPKLIILDATRALVTGGPGGPGKIENLNTIVAGTNPVSVDAFALTLTKWGDKGYKPEEIGYLVKAQAHGIGSYDLSKLNILRKTA